MTSRCGAPLLFGVLIGIAGLSLAFLESVELGSAGRARRRAPSRSRRSARGRRHRAEAGGGGLDAVVLNGWAMLAGGLLLLPVSALSEDWGDFVWSPESVGSIAYLALFGSAIAFVTLTVLLRHISAPCVRSWRCCCRSAR